MVAVALLDGEVYPAQYEPERILRADVQDLLRRVTVAPAADLSARFPAEHPCRVRIQLRDGRILSREKSDYLGFVSRPAGWPEVEEKFMRLAAPPAGEALARRLASATRRLEEVPVADLCSMLEEVGHAQG
jgi:2-methylcitrate dehydratase